MIRTSKDGLIRRCALCQRTLLINADNFHHDRSDPTGFWAFCKPCEKERKAIYRARQKDLTEQEK